MLYSGASNYYIHKCALLPLSVHKPIGVQGPQMHKLIGLCMMVSCTSIGYLCIYRRISLMGLVGSWWAGSCPATP